jgi:hypothetical protein
LAFVFAMFPFALKILLLLNSKLYFQIAFVLRSFYELQAIRHNIQQNLQKSPFVAIYSFVYIWFLLIKFQQQLYVLLLC